MNPVNDRAKTKQQLIAELQTLRAQLASLGEAQVAGEEHRRSFLQFDRRLQAAAGLRAILEAINADQPLDDILDQLLTQASHVLGADAAAFYRLHKPEGVLRIQVARGLESDAATVVIPIAWGPIGRAITTRHPIAATLESRARPDASETGAEAQQPADWQPLVRHYPVVLAVPVIIHDDVYGALVLYQHAGHTLPATHLELAGTFAAHAALAIEHARHFAAAQDKAVLEERHRIARDLHDAVTQALYVVKLYAEAVAQRVAAGDTAAAREYLRDLRAAAQEAIQEMRVLIFELHPSILEQEGLALAIQARLEAVEGHVGLVAELTVEGAHRSPAVVEQALYRVTQEALNNVLKHAQARRISVVLQQQPHRTVLTIVDDGIGFDPRAAIRQGGLGLRGMEERVAQLGGRLTVESSPGMGTIVRAEVES